MTVLILAIDALDSDLLGQFLPRLPNIQRLIASGAQLRVKTTFPPDSDTAWATAMTGLSPADHGIVRFVDPLQKSYEILNRGSENATLAHNTIFDDAARANRRVLAVFPHLAYPLWPSASSVVARAGSRPLVDARPSSLLTDYPDPHLLNGVRGFPGRGDSQLANYLHRVMAQAEADAEFGLRLLRRDDWDLTFVYWSAIDAVGHFFWNHFTRDASQGSQHPNLADAIPRTYEMFDGFIGRYLSAVTPNTDVIVMSDHGHAGRPSTLLNVNELLRRHGLLTTRDRVTGAHLHALERAKRQMIRTVSHYGLARQAGRIMRIFPGALGAFTRPAVVDWRRTLAYGSDMSGIKPYEYGGIHLNRDASYNESYEAVRDDIIGLLTSYRSADGASPVESAIRREELSTGQYIDRYPDVLVQMRPGYGLGWALHSELMSAAPGATLVPGSHRADTATFIARTGRKILSKSMDIINVRASIADLLDLPQDQSYPGRSIFQKASGPPTD